VQDYLHFIYDRFPRRFEIRSQHTVNNFEELWEMIELYRGTQNCGCTIYDANGEGHVPVLDRIAFDFDNPARRLADALRMHRKYRHTKHFIVFSGRGFHFYMYTNGFNGIKNARATLRAAYAHIEKEAEVENDPNLTACADIHCLGIPGTFNYKPDAMCYRIFVTEEDLVRGYDYIRAKAESPPDELVVYGQDLFDLSPFRDPETPRRAPRAITRRANEPDPGSEWLATQPEWVIKVLTDATHCGYRQRFLWVMFMRAEGYSREYTLQVAEKYMTKLKDEKGSKYPRFVQKKALEAVYDGDGAFGYPTSATLRGAGLI
jgi:hypothetical protein